VPRPARPSSDDRPAAITDPATGREWGIELGVHGWPSTGNFDCPLTISGQQAPAVTEPFSAACAKFPKRL
jgi:hypothetical protein